MIELRWAYQEGTTTALPILQYRELDHKSNCDPPWKDVPKVVVTAKSDTAQRTLSRPSDGKGDEAMTDDNLPPPLPQPEFDNLLDHIYEYGSLAEGTIPRARALCEAYARAAILQERERCAKVCEEVENAAWREWKTFYKTYDEGRSNGAGDCAAAIREGRE